MRVALEPMPSVLPFPGSVAALVLLLKKNGVSQKVYSMTVMHARETGLRAFFPAQMAQNCGNRCQTPGEHNTALSVFLWLLRFFADCEYDFHRLCL
jgi:hypothetical protein